MRMIRIWNHVRHAQAVGLARRILMNPKEWLPRTRHRRPADPAGWRRSYPRIPADPPGGPGILPMALFFAFFSLPFGHHFFDPFWDRFCIDFWSILGPNLGPKTAQNRSKNRSQYAIHFSIVFSSIFHRFLIDSRGSFFTRMYVFLRENVHFSYERYSKMLFLFLRF